MLLLYHLPLSRDAPTILENIKAFETNSTFRVYRVNTFLGFPKSLADMRFSVLAFHYSLFGNWPFSITGDFLSFVSRNPAAYKVAFFQDEYRFCRERFDFINQYQIESVYTLLEAEHFQDVYGKHTSAKKITSHLTGYVSDDLIDLARRLNVSDANRTIDIGYRGRPLPAYLGKGALEKTGIAEKFRESAAGLNLKLDIETSEDKRIYGEDWYKFLANCRGCLGVEAGVSIFDVEDKVREARDLLSDDASTDAFEEYEQVLQAWEDRIYYRTISPRHFETAAFRVCQILYEGRYSGVMKPMVHYIPLKKDFSNFEDCIRSFQDKSVRDEITGNAYQDLIASGRYSYGKFIKGFDQDLSEAGLRPLPNSGAAEAALSLLSREMRWQDLRARKDNFIYRDFPGRRPLAALGGPLLRALRKLKGKVA